MKHLLLKITATAIGILGIASVFFALTGLTFAAFNPTGGGTYYLQASINQSQTTITLTSFTEPSSNIPYTMTYLNTDIMYATINPTSLNSEFVSFTGITQNTNGTATLTGVTRGLGRSYPYVASTTLAHSTPGQTQFILSAPPEFYNEYASRRNSQTITGTWTFGSTTPPRYDADPIWANFSTQVFADVSYVNSVVAAGAANASETVKGIIQLATGAQAALGTSFGSTGARLALGNNLATSTPYNSGSNVVPITGTNEKLSQLFLDLTQSFSVSGLWTFGNGFISTASSTFTATTSLPCSNVLSNACKFNGVAYQTPSTQGAAGTVWINNGSGVLTSGIPNGAQYNLASTTSAGTTSGTVNSFAITIPAGTLTASSSVAIDGDITCIGTGGAAKTCSIKVTDQNSTNYVTSGQVTTATNGTCHIPFHADITANNSTSAQTSIVTGMAVCDNINNNADISAGGTSSANSALSTGFFFQAIGSGTGSITITVFSIKVRP